MEVWSFGLPWGHLLSVSPRPSIFSSAAQSQPHSHCCCSASPHRSKVTEKEEKHTQSIWLLKSQHLASYLKVTPTAQHILSSAPVTIKTSSETKSGIKLTTVVNFCCRSLDESNFHYTLFKHKFCCEVQTLNWVSEAHNMREKSRMSRGCLKHVHGNNTPI